MSERIEAKLEKGKMEKIAAAERFHIEADWLSAYWLFSFSHYYDESNLSFGPLRVFNHDTIQGGAGFPTHSHREMEIITYVLEGELAHKDSTGGRGLISAGEVQCMTAGTAIAHSEFNNSETEVCKLLQMWVIPQESGLKPGYTQKKFTPEDRTGRLLAIASGQQKEGALHINQDTTFYISKLLKGQSLLHQSAPGRRTFIYCISGDTTINGVYLQTGDQLRATDVTDFSLAAASEAELILIDLP